MIKINLQTALDYARRGWPVVPIYNVKDGKCTCPKGKDCTHAGKHPLTRHGVNDATTDRKIIKAWWKKWPHANVAIATGKRSGTLVVDVDRRNGGTDAFAAANKKYGKLPLTPKSLTPGGGFHLIFMKPKTAIRPGRGKVLGSGIDVLTTGNYFIAPGSAGLAGNYRWAKGKSADELELAKLPDSWVAALTSDKSAQPAQVAPPSAIPEGSRNTTLTSMAGSMRRAGATEDTIMAALMAQNAGCVPPLVDAEVRGIVTSVCSLYPEGAVSSDPALTLVHGILATQFAGGRHLIVEQGRFWLFEETHWKRVSDDWIKGKILSAIEDFHIKTKSNTASLLNQCVDIIKARLAAKGDRLTGAGDGPAIINTLNGELWLRDDGTIDLRPHCSDSYLTTCLNIAYDPTATCPMYDHALEGIFSKAQKPNAMIRHWNELVGYTIQTSRHIPIIVVGLGGGSNGKTKLVSTIIKLLGENMVSAQQIGSFEGNRFAVASLFGKLLLLDDDVSAGTRLPDGFLKTISEGKVVTGEEKFKAHFTFRARTVPLLLCNTPPSCADLTYGLQRRLMVIPFNKKFTEKSKDTTLFDRIWANELPGVLNRALEGYARLRQRGAFKFPADIKAANKKFLTDGNPVPAFLEECCKEDITGGIYMKDFYASYQTWCSESGITMKQQRTKVKQNLENLGYNFGHGNKGVKILGLRFA